MEFVAKMGLMSRGCQNHSNSFDCGKIFSQHEEPRMEKIQTVVKTSDEFYKDKFAMGDSASGHSSKTTNLPLSIGPDGPTNTPNSKIGDKNRQTTSQAADIENTNIKAPVSLTSRFSRMNFSMSLQADNDPAGKDFPVYRDLTVTVVQASSRHPLHDYDIKFTRAQVLYNSNGDLLVIYTPYLEEGIYQVVPDGKLVPHPELCETFIRQCCLLKRPDTDKMARGSQYLIMGELKEIPTILTETGDLITDMFVKFEKSKDFLRVVFPVLLGCGHKDVWSSQLEIPEVVEPVCLNGNREAFDRWLKLHKLRATPSFEDCFSDLERFREYMNDRFNTWDHVTAECEYYKQMHTALCQGCRDCMSRESYIDSLKLRNVTTKVAYNALSLVKDAGSSPDTPGRPRKKRKAGSKCWTKRSLMSKAISSLNTSILDPATSESYRLPEKLKYGFYRESYPAGEYIPVNSQATTDSDVQTLSVDTNEYNSAKSAELFKESQHENRAAKGKPHKRKRSAITETIVPKNTIRAEHDCPAKRVMTTSGEKVTELNEKVEKAISPERKSSVGNRICSSVDLPTLGETSTSGNLTNACEKNAANERFNQSEYSEYKTESTDDKTTILDITMETEPVADASPGRSKRNRKRKAVCTCAGCIQSLLPLKKKARIDTDITKDDTVQQSDLESRAN